MPSLRTCRPYYSPMLPSVQTIPTTSQFQPSQLGSLSLKPLNLLSYVLAATLLLHTQPPTLTCLISLLPLLIPLNLLNLIYSLQQMRICAIFSAQLSAPTLIILQTIESATSNPHLSIKDTIQQISFHCPTCNRLLS
jgi:hypothetical protein